MRVLITRPLEDAKATAEILRARGHEPVVAPLLEIRYRDGVSIPPECETILATSTNGIRALARNTPRRNMRVFAVGAQSAQAAKQAGFADVSSADGDANDLADLVMRAASRDSVLLHAAGSETRGDFAARLMREGFSVRTVTLYDAVAATTLPGPIRAGTIDAALFYSPRSANIFAALAGDLDAGEVAACCISAATAQALASLVFREIRMAARPNQDALLALLG
jgi:uroporphyrinogen-III synthase